VKLDGPKALQSKTVIDACNPIGGGPPINGVLSYLTTLTDSLTERLQKACPSAHLVKAFNSVGNAQMVNPHFAGGRPTMFICGNDASAKRVVTQILDQFGWDTEDMGAVEAARAIEPLCMLWCIPGVGKPEATKSRRRMSAAAFSVWCSCSHDISRRRPQAAT
jgi:predicted dinucleotide-binding enzyme